LLRARKTWKTREPANAGLHDFHELLMIALCGGQGAVDMALFGRSKEPFLRGFLKLANGLLSHDTFSRLFGSWTQCISAPDSSGSWRGSPRASRA
jgi:hypothetical protein